MGLENDKKTRKILKTFSLDYDVVVFIEKQNNMSEYVNSLLSGEMNKSYGSVKLEEEIVKADIERKNKEDRVNLLKDSQAAWNSLSKEVQDKIMVVGLSEWTKNFYKKYKMKGTLTLDDIVSDKEQV